MLRCFCCSRTAVISVRDNACSGAAVRPCTRVSNAFGELRTIATSLLQEEGEISHDIVLKLLSHDFGHVYRRSDKLSLNRPKVSRTTSILTVLRDLRFAGKLSSSYVSLLIHLHFPLISPYEGA